jgi:hypothetical protein
VSGDICGNRQSRAALDRRIVTTCTAALRARRSGIVLSVIELDVERFVEARREIPQRRIATADVGVADRTHRDLRRRELAAMTVSTRFVTRKAWRRGIICALVTGVAGKGTVTLAVMQKLRVIKLRPLRRGGSKDKQNHQHKPHHLMSLRLNGGNSAIAK